jgi:hypothetical protein
MSKRFYFPNIILSDPILSFTVEIGTDLSVYIRNKNGQMIKPDYIILKHLHRIAINHEGFLIYIKGYDKVNKNFIYTITKQ